MEKELIRKTKYGLVKGTSNEYAEIYMNIPYAKPPVGDLLFKHPIETDTYEGILDCTKGGANPVQHNGRFGVPNQSFDCLDAYIFIPKGLKGPLPVLFWIYGGAYSNGGVGSYTEDGKLYYDMSLLAYESKCVVVTFNYRVSIWGFMNLSVLGDKFDFNNGVMDQLMALRFTKENVANFEGDPNNIILFGQSAGGASVLTLLSMEKTKGLYKKAVVMSPCVDHYFTIEESEKIAHKFLKRAKIKKPNDIFNADLNALRKAIDKSVNLFLLSGDVRCYFSPIIDGKIIKDYPINLINNSSVAMLTGYTTRESDLFLDKYPAIILPFVQVAGKVKVKKGEDSYRHRISDAYTLREFHEPITRLANTYKGDVYFYEYEHVYNGKNSYHALDIFLVVTSKDDPTAKKLRKILSDFAYNTNPGWDEYHKSKRIFKIN